MPPVKQSLVVGYPQDLFNLTANWRPQKPTSFLPYGRQWIEEDDIEAVVEVLKSSHLTQGPAVEEFEKYLARYVGAGEAVACANGTAALHLCAMALGLGPGDAWITTPLTFVATANAARYVGATPIFADVDETGCLDPATVPTAVEKARAFGLSPKVLVAVDYAGQPADWERLKEIADHYNLVLIDDACHALGAEWQDKSGIWYKIGSSQAADLTVFSFHPVKHVTTGEGGAIATDNSELADKLRTLRSHGITKSNLIQANFAIDGKSGMNNPWYYEQQLLGFNYRLTDIQAALGCAQLKKNDRFLSIRRQLALEYDKAFSDLNAIKPLKNRAEMDHAYHLYVVLIDYQAIGLSRAEFMSQLSQAGIGTQVHYIPINLQPDFQRLCGTKPGDCPSAERLYGQLLSIPLYPLLNHEEQRYVIDSVLSLIKRGRVSTVNEGPLDLALAAG